MKPSPLESRPKRTPNVIFTDVDDTLTWQGRLPLDSLSALYRLKDAGITVIPVTGGCAGWCDCIIRTWPVDYVVGENGSFYLSRSDDGLVKRQYLLEDKLRERNLHTLKQLTKEFAHAFPDIPTTPDQPFRLTDIAFDIGQENHVSFERAEQAVSWLQTRGALARKSSIHINVWLGNYNKAIGAMRLLKDTSIAQQGDCLFIGDSANDEAMFEHFKDTVGVANIEATLAYLHHQPAYITKKPGGLGFAELADYLLN